MFSIKRRLLTVGSLVVIFFLLLTALTLEKAFRSVADQARDERLHSNIYTILAAAELEGDSLVIPEILPEQKLMLPESGLIAYVLDQKGDVIWNSSSSVGQVVPNIAVIDPGKEETIEINDPKQMQMLKFGVSWQSYDKNEYQFTVAVIEDSEGYNLQISSYRHNLYGWLAALVVVLVVVQLFILRWGLNPLSVVEKDIVDVESGKTNKLSGEYPREIIGITRNLNILIENERKRLKQYQDTLANLAHSLKTPLAVLRNEVESDGKNQLMLEQIGRIDSMVEYQLSRAALSGRVTYSSAIKIKPIAAKLIAALDKVFFEKGITSSIDCDDGVEINALEGDLMELLGNLLDNAYKWTSTSVLVSIRQLEASNCRIKGVEICIEDDGPGIERKSIESILKRGGRADTTTPGHGIGMAVVKDLVDSYIGTLIINRGRSGGALIIIKIPPR